MSVKLTYFDVRGRGEVIRFLLKYGGIAFEDNRIPMEDWGKMKSKTPYGQMPLYEEHGKVMNQTKAISRYLAKKIKLAGINDWEDLELDALVDTIGDLLEHFIKFFWESDPELKEKLKATVINETAPFYFDRLEKIAEKNFGFLAFGRLTWVDFFFVTGLDVMKTYSGIDLLENRPNLQSVVDNVVDLPVIKEWIEIRPKSAM